MEKFDIVVIGSGPAGFSAAMRAFDYGKQVCLIEGGHIGGTGIINGVLTSKTMWELSNDYYVAASVDRGYRASGLSVDYDKVIQTVYKAAKHKQYQMLSQIETFRRKTDTEPSVTLKTGWATFIDKNHVRIKSEHSEEIIEAENFVIATGTIPRDYPGLEIDQKQIINSDGILNLKKFPDRMLIIGSGIIGCEFATIFGNFKQTEVHLLDRTQRVLPFEDDDVGEFVSKNLEQLGVKIHYTAVLREIRRSKDSLEVVLDYQDGHSQVLEVDVALVAIGRVANIKNLGLENIGIKPNEKGYLTINDYCALSNTTEKCNIYAAGDITGHSQLYSVAEFQGRYTIKGMFNKKVVPLKYNNMPTLMFFKPEVAAVGLNEKQLQHRKIAYKAVWYSTDLVNRAMAMRATNGFIKILISNDGEDQILGMRAAGPQASAFIVSVAHLINEGNSLKEVLKTVHPHPSITEGIQECLRVFSNKSIFKEAAFPDLIHTKIWIP